jgi:hypothetical protein
MPSAAQTPTVFLNAAGKETLDNPKCRKALAACGYTPDDFGTYSQVQKRCGSARKITKGAKSKGITRKGDAKKDDLHHARWLAQGQSGHISENNRHQTDREHNAGSHCPLYDTNNAPCMPHAGMAGFANTQHGAVTNTDIQNGNAAAGAVGPGGKMGIRRERAATRDATQAALDWGMNDDQPAAAQARQKRFDAIREINSKAGAEATKPKDGKQLSDDEIKKNYQKQRKTALECIEAFFNAQWKAMANNTQKRKAEAEAKAKAETKAAQDALDKVNAKKPVDKKAQQKAQARLDKAKTAEAEATKDNDAVKKLDPDNVNQCMGQSRAPEVRTENTKGDPNDPSIKPDADD